MGIFDALFGNDKPKAKTKKPKVESVETIDQEAGQ